ADAGHGIEHRVVSLMDDGNYGRELRAAGVALHCLNLHQPTFSPGAALGLAGIIRRYRPDTLMTWLYHADLMGTLCAMLAGVSPRRVAWNLRCSDMDFDSYAPTTRRAVRMLARMSAWPGIIAVNSEAGKRHHKALGYRPRAWAYLPNGLDTNEWRPDPGDRARVRRELDVSDGDVLIGMVARRDPQKDHATFLDACARLAADHPNVRVLMVGRGTSELSLPDELHARVTALEFRTDVPRLMRGLDLHVLSSAYGEGFPNVVAEAMASEVPCVVTDVGDAAMLAANHGLVVPPRDPAALARAMLALLTEGEQQRQQRGRVARTYIVENFQIDKALERYRTVWQRTWRSSLSGP
ncbi:MAG: glycosyltransferase, partial [Rhodospirillales bacterium]